MDLYDALLVSNNSGGDGGSTSNNVTQTSINDSERHRLILSNSGTDNTEVAGVYKNNKLTFDPRTSRVFIGNNSLSTGETSINGSIQLQQKSQNSETSTVLTALTGLTSDSPNFDVTLIEDTWDGTNHSLKDAIANTGSSYSEVTGTLVSGATSITLTDSGITTDSTFDIYTSIWGAEPTDVTVANGSITLTFEAQSTDMNVKVKVS